MALLPVLGSGPGGEEVLNTQASWGSQGLPWRSYSSKPGKAVGRAWDLCSNFRMFGPY